MSGKTTPETAPQKRLRRHDPDRKDRIIDATLQMIAEHGAANTTHRLIAEAVDVSPGSLTYYFTSLEDLIEQAFSRHADRLSVLYEHHFERVGSRADLVQAITTLIHGNLGSSEADSIITFELYLAALRNPQLRSITQSWMAASQAVLERFMDRTTAQGVDALIEGLIVHTILATDPIQPTKTALYVDRALGDVQPQPADQGQP